jgi:uncharacterized protein DUF3292
MAMGIFKAVLLILPSSVLKGVPTNAQLTITLLRLGEANRAPLPPPPRTNEPLSQQPVELSEDVFSATGGDRPLNATKQELQEAISHDTDTVNKTGGPDNELTKSTKSSRLLGLFKGVTKAAVSTAINVDKMSAKMGSKSAKKRVGAVPRRGEAQISGPTEFNARYEGKEGVLSFIQRPDSQRVAFSTHSHTKESSESNWKGSQPVWTVPISDIKELRKRSGYGFKSKLVVGWVLEQEIRDGLEIVDRLGNSWVLTAVPLRDELFNRLCAMGGQRWEAG